MEHSVLSKIKLSYQRHSRTILFYKKALNKQWSNIALIEFVVNRHIPTV